MFEFLKRYTGRDLPGALAADAEASGLCGITRATATVDESDVRDLPEPVARYMRFMNVVGRPRDTSFRAQFNGRFRMRPGQRVMPIEAWQYNTRFPVARLFHMRLDMAGFIPMLARDSYVDGRGRMLGKLLGVVTVADGRGDEFDIGELTTWLNDAILLCPSMLLDAATAFSAVDAKSFDVSFADSGRTVSARVFIDERGAPHDFSTTDRFAALPGGPVRAEWTTPISGWDDTGERPIPGAGAAVWHLPEGPFTYIDGRFAKNSLEYNIEPDVAATTQP
jgi:hypothetical protein